MGPIIARVNRDSDNYTKTTDILKEQKQRQDILERTNKKFLDQIKDL